MNLLALDTATEQLALALIASGTEATLNAEGGATASATLIPQTLALLQRQSLRVGDLDAIAFGRGPGAFTGLRTAVSVAQGLAFGAGKPVLAIDSLLIVADDALAQARAGTSTSTSTSDAAFRVWVVMDARMEQVYAAAYRHVAGAWQVEAEPALYDLPVLHARWAGAAPEHLAGSALAAFGERLLHGAAHTWPTQHNRAAALLRLARAAWLAGATLPAEQALPLYLRDKIALTTAERAALRAARDNAEAIP